MKNLGRKLDQLIGGGFVLACALLVFLTGATLFEVVVRYVFNMPTKWVLEFAPISLSFLTFLSAAWVQEKEGHVKLEILTQGLNMRKRALVDAATSMVAIILWIIIACYSGWVASEIWAEELPNVPIALPQGPLIAVMCVGSILLSLQLARRTYRYLRIWRGG